MLKRRFVTCAFVLAAGAIGCARDTWPVPPPVDQVKYQQEYADFRKGQLETAAYALPLRRVVARRGRYAIRFGPGAPDRAAGQRDHPTRRSVPPERERRDRDPCTRHAPAPRGRQRRRRRSSCRSGAAARDRLRPSRGLPGTAGRGHDDRPRRRRSAAEGPADRNLPPRSEVAGGGAFRCVRKAESRADREHARAGSRSDGARTARVSDQRTAAPPHRARGAGQRRGKTTFSGYRMLSAKAVPNGQWTVLDFNMASNPPCAYSKFTMCPLPPRENRLALAIEAGVKRHPTARGYAE